MKKIFTVFAIWGLFIVSAYAEDLNKCLQGYNYSQYEKYSEAIILFEDCIKEGELSKESLVKTYRNIGIAYRKSGNYEESLNYYDKAINLNPSDPVSDYVNRGNTYSEMGSFKNAHANYDIAFKLDPNFGEVDYNQGIAFEKEKLYEKAELSFVSAYKKGLRTPMLYQRMVVYGLLK